MAATKRQFNWTGVTFTPSGGSASTATGVTQVQINPNGSVVKFSGDGDRFSTCTVNDFVDPEIVVTTADLIWLRTLTIGTRGTLAATHKDAKGATAGGIAYSLGNAIVVDNPTGGQHRQFGTGTVRFNAESVDGTTDPLSSQLV